MAGVEGGLRELGLDGRDQLGVRRAGVCREDLDDGGLDRAHGLLFLQLRFLPLLLHCPRLQLAVVPLQPLHLLQFGGPLRLWFLLLLGLVLRCWKEYAVAGLVCT